MLIILEEGRVVNLSRMNLLKSRRYVVEQFNGHLKENVLDECWLWPRGLVKKAAMVTAGLISYVAEAIRSLVCWRRKLENGEQVLGLTQ